jgi:transposase InsO family protein
LPSGNREKRALGRFAAVSVVAAKVTAGMSLSRAIEEVTKTALVGPNGEALALSRASLYRWHAAFTAKKFAGLLDEGRPQVPVSRVLPSAFIDFMVKEKTIDPDASLPEIIRRAEVDGVVGASCLSRTSVWRAANRLQLPIFADKMSRHDDARRFAHEHRMRMVLCDGKHFRAGATKVRRVVFSYLDDATRKVLGAVVGTAEDRSLFLRGLMQVIRRAGLMDGLYLDRGSAFTADDSALVCGRLGIPLVFGRVRYPAGHGKIERYNQTILNDLLRGISADKAIDVSYAWLQTMIEHYLTTLYNPRRHEGLNGASPNERWDADSRELRLVDDLRKVEDHFIVTETRRVSRDNVVMLDDVPYEMPRGQRGRRVQVFRHFLDDTFTVLHEGRHVVLAKVDLHANAVAQRTKRLAATEPAPAGKIRTAAQRAFAKDFASVVSPDGDFYDRSE